MAKFGIATWTNWSNKTLANRVARHETSHSEVGLLMSKLLIMLAAVGAASFASAQSSPSSNLYPLLSSDSSGWTWYMRRTTLRTANLRTDQLYDFWMVGTNRGSSNARVAIAHVKLSCANKQFVQLRLVSRDGAGKVISEAAAGDHKTNWKAISSGTPTAAAYDLLCLSHRPSPGLQTKRKAPDVR